MDEDVEIKEEDDSFSISAEDSSSDEDANDEKIAELTDQVRKQPYSYELHVQLITLCRKLGDLNQLRSARENLSKLFPLTQDLWLDWLSDEKSLITTKEQKDSLTALFERAVKDYASVSVWLEYVQFSIGKIGDKWDEDGLADIRQTFERAITAVGIHVTHGCLIWEAYKEFEKVYLHYLQNKGASEKQLRDQEDRIYNIFRRQLSIPLLDMNKTYEEFKELYNESTYPNIKSIDYSYKKALQKLEQVKEFENALCQSEYPHYEEYRAYIEYEKKEGDPSRVQNVFERAIIENCLKEELWLDYTKYMGSVIKISDMSLPVYKRAVRNLPWSVQLWVRYFRAMESYQETHEKITEKFEDALMMGFVEANDFKELWLANLDYLRRRIKIEDLDNGVCNFKEIEDVFNKALTQMVQYFWGSEAEYIITKYWIFFNVKYKKNTEIARENWRELIEHGHREEARVWLDYVTFERVYGDAAHYRKSLLLALSRAKDQPETFLDLLITFEREEGTLDSLEKSLSKCETVMLQIKSRKAHKNESLLKSDFEAYVQMDSEGFKIPPPPVKLHSSDNSHVKYDSEAETNQKNRSSNLEEQPDIKWRKETNQKKRTSELEEKPELKKRKVDACRQHGTTITHDSSKDDKTVFASNLSFHIDENKIKQFFSQTGEVEEIRLVKDFKGRSKGFCYILYKTQDDAKKALDKDRDLLDGRPVFISSCEDKKNNPSFQSKFKFAVGLERNKLFVKNLPFSTTKEDLETMYKEYGQVKDVRIVTYRNGHSKGLAYVEFEDETAASNAVVKTDGIHIGDHVISVAISNPPPRGEKRERSISLGGGRIQAKGPRGRGRTQLTLVPRCVSRAPATKRDLQNGQKCEERKSLNNSDFAKMLQKGNLPD